MTYTLTVQKRESGRAEEIRGQGLIPAVVYGPQINSQPVAVEYHTFEKLYNEAGESNLIDIVVNGAEPMKVLIQEVQYDPLKGRIWHVDFRQINMQAEIDATMEIRLIGESPAVKESGGTLIKGPEEISIHCLPKDLVSHIDIDLSQLKTFENIIHVRDLKLPPGIVVTDQPDLVLAKVAPPLTEEQFKAMEEAGPTSVEEVEVEKKGKKEEEGAAGEEAAAPSAPEAKKKE